MDPLWMLHFARDNVKSNAFLRTRRKVHHEQDAGTVRAHFERRRTMVGKIMEIPENLSFLDIGSQIDSRLPDPSAGSRNVIVQIGGVHETRRSGAFRIDPHNIARQNTVVAQNILDAFVGVAGTFTIDRLAETEFATDGDLALRLGLIRQ